MSEESTLTFKYIFPDDYNPMYANGAFGGVTPDGEIIVNFYQERHALPVSQTHRLNQDGTLGEEVNRLPEDHETSMVRFISTGVTLSLKSAKQIHDWLGERIEALEAVQEQARVRGNERKKES